MIGSVEVFMAAWRISLPSLTLKLCWIYFLIMLYCNWSYQSC